MLIKYFHIQLLYLCKKTVRLQLNTVTWISDYTSVLHNKGWIYFTSITTDNDFLFLALKTPEIVTLEYLFSISYSSHLSVCCLQITLILLTNLRSCTSHFARCYNYSLTVITLALSLSWLTGHGDLPSYKNADQDHTTSLEKVLDSCTVSGTVLGAIRHCWKVLVKTRMCN
jgi:hypothetical protein